MTGERSVRSPNTAQPAAMVLVADPAELRRQVGAWRRAGLRVGFVPTMGNLHRGHLSLMERCREQADRVVASIFVNPLQFGPNEDYDSYPRTPEADRDALARTGVDLLFLPPAELIYPGDPQGRTRIHVPALETLLCGVSRPHFFSGVATVVNLLFNLVQPDIALFGEKDYQQLLVIRRMVADLHMPVEVVGGPIVREASGLAMSSRNAYLTDQERARAATLYRMLQTVEGDLLDGKRGFRALEVAGAAMLERAGMRPDYVSIRRAADLGEARPGDRELRLLAAAWLGKARLIDNIGVTLLDVEL